MDRIIRISRISKLMLPSVPLTDLIVILISTSVNMRSFYSFVLFRASNQLQAYLWK